MAITAKQNEDLQKQYDLLRSQGQTKEQATSGIKSTLQGATTKIGANVYDTLKSNFKTGGVSIGEPNVKINTDVMRTYNPDYNPDVPTGVSGVLGTKPTDSIAKNNQALSNVTGTPVTETPVKTELDLVREETARKQAELDKRNQEFTALENKGATSELGAGVIPKTGKGTAQTDFLSKTSDFLKTNLQTELANLDAEKQRLQESIKTGSISSEDQKTTLQPYEQFLDKVTKLKEINEGQIKREQEDLKTRYSTAIDRTRKSNELALLNAQKISAITGTGFTSGGIQGINNIIDEGNQAITNLEQDRESMLSKYKDADAKLDLEYLDTITTIQNESKKALQDRYNSVITQIQKIDAEKGKATKEGLLAIKDVAKEYFDSLDKQWEKDYKVMDFNYKKLLDYKKDVREQESVTRDQQKDQLALLQKGDLTSLSDEDIMNLGQDMDLDSGTLKGLILVREQQKKDSALEQQKLTQMTPAQKAQYNLDVKKFGLEQAKFNLEQGVGTGEVTNVVPPSGTLTSTNLQGKMVTLDQNAMEGLKKALASIPQTVIGAQQFRTPEQQAKLVAEGKSWTMDSKHQKGLAVDIYGDNKLSKPTQDQIDALNANGWYQPKETMAKGDYGHFEYTGEIKTGGGTSSIEKDATLERIRRGQVTDTDLGKIQKKAVAGGWGEEFTNALKKGMKTTLTDTQIKGLATVDDKIQKDAVLDNISAISQQKETIKGLLNTDINANGFNDIALINAFQKIVDPGVAVREGDVSLLQSGIALKDKLNPNNLLTQVAAGTKLTPETRKQMLESTTAIYNAQSNYGNELLKKKYFKLADNYGIDLADYGYLYDTVEPKKTPTTTTSPINLTDAIRARLKK